MIATSPSENGQVLHVIPSTQTGMAQVIIPQEPLVDVTSPQGESVWDLCRGVDSALKIIPQEVHLKKFISLVIL